MAFFRLPDGPTTRRVLFAGAGILLLGACSGPELGPVEPVSFAGRPQIRLNVARVETVDQTVPSTGSNLTQSPAAAIRSWGAARLRAEGHEGVARLIIQQATLTTQRLEPKSGVAALFNDQPAQKLTLLLAARLEIGHVGMITGGYADVRVERSTTLTDGSSNADLVRTRNGLLQDGMGDFDRQFEANIRQYLAPLVLP
jgi:hypothetical protein